MAQERAAHDRRRALEELSSRGVIGIDVEEGCLVLLERAARQHDRGKTGAQGAELASGGAASSGLDAREDAVVELQARHRIRVDPAAAGDVLERASDELDVRELEVGGATHLRRAVLDDASLDPGSRVGGEETSAPHPHPARRAGAAAQSEPEQPGSGALSALEGGDGSRAESVHGRGRGPRGAVDGERLAAEADGLEVDAGRHLQSVAVLRSRLVDGVLDARVRILERARAGRRRSRRRTRSWNRQPSREKQRAQEQDSSEARRLMARTGVSLEGCPVLGYEACEAGVRRAAGSGAAGWERTSRTRHFLGSGEPRASRMSLSFRVVSLPGVGRRVPLARPRTAVSGLCSVWTPRVPLSAAKREAAQLVRCRPVTPGRLRVESRRPRHSNLLPKGLLFSSIGPTPPASGPALRTRDRRRSLRPDHSALPHPS